MQSEIGVLGSEWHDTDAVNWQIGDGQVIYSVKYVSAPFETVLSKYFFISPNPLGIIHVMIPQHLLSEGSHWKIYFSLDS